MTIVVRNHWTRIIIDRKLPENLQTKHYPIKNNWTCGKNMFSEIKINSLTSNSAKMIFTFKNHMWSWVGHVVAVDRLTEHPACSHHLDRTLGNAQEDSNENLISKTQQCSSLVKANSLQIQQRCNKLTSFDIWYTATSTMTDQCDEKRKIQGHNCIHANQISPHRDDIEKVTRHECRCVWRSYCWIINTVDDHVMVEELPVSVARECGKCQT